MFRFFRQTRKDQLMPDKTRKYLLYAVGEILLVVIGILIALQVNNWNEERKMQTTETSLLNDLKSNLAANFAEIESALDFNRETLDNYEIILRYVEQDLPQDSTLNAAFFTFSNWAAPYFARSAYESLKSRGLDNLKNAELRAALTAMYDERFTHLTNDYDRAEWQLSSEVRIEFVKKYVRYLQDDTAIVINYKEMISDDEFENALRFTMRFRRWGVDVLSQALVEIDNLIELIDSELENR